MCIASAQLPSLVGHFWSPPTAFKYQSKNELYFSLLTIVSTASGYARVNVLENLALAAGRYLNSNAWMAPELSYLFENKKDWNSFQIKYLL